MDLQRSVNHIPRQSNNEHKESVQHGQRAGKCVNLNMDGVYELTAQRILVSPKLSSPGIKSLWQVRSARVIRGDVSLAELAHRLEKR